MRNFFTIVIILLSGTVLFAQKKEVKQKYHRSSLHTIFVKMNSKVDTNIDKNKIIVEAYQSMPFPDKYDNMSIAETTVDPSKIEITSADTVKTKNKTKKKFALGIGKKLKSIATDFIPDLDGENAKELKSKIDKYMNEHKIAHKLLAKWYNRKPDGSFDVDLIRERGNYDASLLDVKIANGAARGSALLEDAGSQLIKNTFVVVTRMKYVRNEVIANAMKLAASKLPSYAQAAVVLAADGFLKEGYSVWTKAFLYRLKWDKDIESRFYNEYWVDKNNMDNKKKEAFYNSDLFKMEYIGKEAAITMITKKIGEVLGTSKKAVRDQEEFIKEAAIRTIEKVYVKLQKHNDVFKPRIPLYSGNPITAKIGMKEGLKGGEKFEVLEQVLDKKTGKTKYVKKGVIKVSKEKGKIWDNRYSLNNKTDKNGVTYFTGKKKYYSGMLIRQIK